MAHQPVSAIKFNAFLLIAYPAKQSFCITLAFAQTTQREHTTTVQKPEIAHIGQNINTAHPLKYTIKSQRELTTQPAFLATGTPFGINVIISFFPIFQHLVYQFRRVLQISIHHNAAIAGGVIKTRQHGYLFTKVTRKVDIIHPLVLLPQPAEAFQRSVAAAIIDKQDFPLINGIAIDKLYQTLIQSGQHRFLIIYRNQKSHFLHIILHYHKDSSKILLLFENKPH